MPPAPPAQGHARWVRISHWIVTLSVAALAFTGVEILMVHPRLYWGEVGNDLTAPLLELPISRNHQHGGWSGQTPFFAGSASPITASRTYDIFNQNGWGRSLHFLAGWFLVVSGAIYLLLGLLGGHFRRHLRARAVAVVAGAVLARSARSPPAADPGGHRRAGLRPAAARRLRRNRVRDAAADGAHRRDDVAGHHRRVSVPVDGVRRPSIRPHDPLLRVRGDDAVPGRAPGDGGEVGLPAPDARHDDRRDAHERSTRSISRRDLLAAGLASAGGLLLSGCSRPVPPTYGSLLRLGDNLTYAAHRVLLPGESLVKEYSRGDLSSFPAVGATNPGDPAGPRFNEAYRHCSAAASPTGGCRWKGWWRGPDRSALAELKALPSRTQITRHVCEEGWTAIGEWTGVPLSRVLDAVGLQPAARFVSYYSFDHLADSIDLLDALHPQTLLAYGMNGRDLPVQHGAPLRLRVERQMGYKSMKFLTRLVVTEHLDDGGESGNPKNGWAWYVGI